MEKDTLQTAIEHHLAGRLADAEKSYRAVLAHAPGDVNARNNLGVVLKGLGRIDEAMACYQETIRIQPDCAEAFYNLANAQRGLGRLDEAADSYHQVLKLKGDYADAWNNLGLVRAEQGRLDEAIANCRLAIKLKPDTADGYINLLYALYHHPDYDARQLLEETRVWGRRQTTDAEYRPVVVPLAGRRLRVGYLSPFFGMCADAHFILPLLGGHDRSQFEIFCFARTVRDDEVSARMRSHCDHWVDMRAAEVRQAVEFIRGQKLDVLVVMSRPADECQKIVAWRCAPVQMTWMTFASCTSGLEAVDYRISDSYLDPVGSEEVYAEKTVRLPETAWCHDPMENLPVVQAPPCLVNRFVTFGSLNRVGKITRPVVAAWGKVLAAVPGSRLLLLAPVGSVRGRLLEEFGAVGIDAGRIEFVDRLNRAEYLKMYHRIDISLDTFPFCGQTTTLDSLWMGVPVVTLTGRTCVGRTSASALNNLGLGELVAGTAEEFVAIAAGLARDLAKLRASLRKKMEQSALTDSCRFARTLESVYREVLASC